MKPNCNSRNRVMRHRSFRIELLEKYPDCLERIIVHIMAHYLEPDHGRHLVTLVDRDWPGCREQLDGALVRDEDCGHA